MGHRLQVIVKIQSIELTPEKPTFPGVNWQVEVSSVVLGDLKRSDRTQGMGNEKIIATAIYYYDSENMVDDCLNFRQSVDFVSYTHVR
jgi:hypothetical protein